ncbi:hypothetical protein ACFU1R_28740 [Priestia megaterium]|uniref:hypothetical protein n=1 Tax=Priestia megaterium TaxID=1404 RepID=UPI00366D2EF9
MADFIKDYGVLVTSLVSLVGVSITSVVTLYALKNNIKMQEKQLENQQILANRQFENQQILNSQQFENQREMVRMQNFLDKRMEAILEFRRDVEDTIGVLKYFFSDKADFERITALKVVYKNPTAFPKAKEDIDDEKITKQDMINMLDRALKQISPIEDKMASLTVSSSILFIYLEDWQEEVFQDLLKYIEDLSHQLINGIKAVRETKNPRSFQLLSYVHIDESYKIRLKDINDKANDVRDILKEYLHLYS